MTVLVEVALFQLVAVDLSAHQRREPVEIDQLFRVRHLLKVLLQKLRL